MAMLAWPYAELRLGAMDAPGVLADIAALLHWQWQVRMRFRLQTSASTHGSEFWSGGSKLYA